MPTTARYASRTVQLDWLRFNVPLEFRLQAMEILREFGFVDLKPARSRWTFVHGEIGRHGCTMLWDRSNAVRKGGPLACFELPGSWCARVRDFSSLLRQLAAIDRFKVTRVDIAVDFFEFRTHDDAPRSLCDCVEASARAHQVVGARTFRPDETFTGGMRTARCLYFGVRGKDGSGRFVRVYDKGLEQGGAEGVWERFEVELSDDVARQAVRRLVDVEPTELLAEAYNVAVSCIDFREDPDDMHTSRRPRCDWWVLIARAADRLIRATRAQRPSLAALGQWFTSGPLPAMRRLREKAGWSWDEFMSYFGGDRGSPAAERVADEWCEEVAQFVRDGRPRFA